jgi:hypothetical protein
MVQNNYQIETDGAEAILKYVQTWTEYGGYDSDNVFMNDIPKKSGHGTLTKCKYI